MADPQQQRRDELRAELEQHLSVRAAARITDNELHNLLEAGYDAWDALEGVPYDILMAGVDLRPATGAAIVKAAQQQGGMYGTPWWYSETLASSNIAVTPSEQATTYLSCAAGAWGGIHYWRKAHALMQADAASKNNPQHARELRVRWNITELQMERAAFWAAHFRRTGVAAALGAPLLYAAWMRAKRVSKS